jgi:hypothetical protein
MKMKEVLEARWKVLTFTLLALLASAGNIAMHQLSTNLIPIGTLTLLFNRFVGPSPSCGLLSTYNSRACVATCNPAKWSELESGALLE